MSIIENLRPGYHGRNSHLLNSLSAYDAEDDINYQRMRKLALANQTNNLVQANIRIISAGQFGKYGACSIINPGALYANNQFQLLCRGEVHEEVWNGDFLAYQPMPVWCILDNELKLKAYYPLRYRCFPENSRPEDWRLFKYRDKLYANHSVYTLLDREEWAVRSRLGISEIDIENGELRLCCLLEPPFKASNEEKNWSFFVHDDSILCLYSLRPYIILKIDIEQGKTEKYLEASPTFNWHEKGKFIGNSTNLISWDKENYILFVHDFLEPRYGQRDRAYMQYGVLISKSTLLPTSIIPEPLIIGGDELGRHPGVHYTSAIVNRAGQLYSFYGEGDTHTGAVIFNKVELNRLFKQHNLYSTKKKRATRKIMKGLDPRKGIIISFPRSGLNWLRYCIEHFTGLRTAGQTKLIADGDLAVYRTHNVTQKDESPDSCDCPFYDQQNNPLHSKAVLLLRDYRETFIRIAKDEDIDLSSINEMQDRVMPHFYKYFENLKAYDQFSGKKMLVRYPDLISDFSAVEKILTFLDLPYSLDGFDLEYHRRQSIELYNQQHVSFTKDDLYNFSFHKNDVDSEFIQAVDDFVEHNYRDIADMYCR